MNLLELIWRVVARLLIVVSFPVWFPLLVVFTTLGSLVLTLSDCATEAIDSWKHRNA